MILCNKLHVQYTFKKKKIGVYNNPILTQPCKNEISHAAKYNMIWMAHKKLPWCSG